MKNKNILKLVAGAFLLLLILGLALFEKKNISTEDWNQQYKFDSESPYGGYVFHELLEEKFGAQNIVKHYKDTLLSKIESGNNLYILMANSHYLTHSKQRKIKDFVAKGNQALLISKSNYGTIIPTSDNEIGLDFMENKDSIFNFSFVGSVDSLSYKHYIKKHDEASSFYHKVLDFTGDSISTSLAKSENHSSFFFITSLDTGEIYQHIIPELFSNIAAQQDFYLDHFNRVIDYVDGDMIILDHPSFDNTPNSQANESPIQYILGERSLKWAYYLLLLTTICFLFFRGKRKQRIIPIPEKNENTSIQYVDTLSDLFEQQNQNEKLVPHMETVFKQRIKQKYYLAPDNENFVQLLSKKSRIPENQITAILNYFETGSQDYNFSDDQLIMLHKRLEDFYNNAE